MNLWRSLGILGFFIAAVAVPVCRADDADVLKTKELEKVGTSYVLPIEKELIDGMKDLRKLKVKLDVEARQRKELEAKLKYFKNGISGLDHDRRKLYDQYTQVQEPQKSNLVAQIKSMDSRLIEANGIREDLEKQLNGLGAEERTKFINQVLDLALKVDAATDQYKVLIDDPDVKLAIEKLNQPGKAKVKLGPTPEFTASVTMLKKWRGDVSSDVIPIKHESQVPLVEVTLNGTVIREMVLDSGASMVCLTADLAKQLNMIPTEKDQTIRFTQADGKQVEAKKMTLKSVRVGQFTVTDVDCAVLPPSLVAAEPLLGGTFLNNFIFKIDPKAGELHLAVVAGNPKVTTTGAPKDPKTAVKSTGK